MGKMHGDDIAMVITMVGTTIIFGVEQKFNLAGLLHLSIGPHKRFRSLRNQPLPRGASYRNPR